MLKAWLVEIMNVSHQKFHHPQIQARHCLPREEYYLMFVCGFGACLKAIKTFGFSVPDKKLAAMPM